MAAMAIYDFFLARNWNWTKYVVQLTAEEEISQEVSENLMRIGKERICPFFYH